MPCLPDVDVIAFRWVPYGHTFGHRGFSHSIGCALLVGVLVALWLAWRHKIERTLRSMGRIVAAVAALWTSHGVLDAMTTGGKGILLFYPISHQRVWAPARFIPASPLPGYGARSTAGRARWRERVLSRRAWNTAIPRAFVRLSDNPRFARPLFIAGIAATELLFLAPLGIFALLRRRIRAPTRALVGVAGLAFLAGEGWLLWSERHVASDRRVLADSFRTPYIALLPQEPVVDGAAVLFPGWRCNASMMLPLARTLARNGLTSYIVDMPGHGRSPTSLPMPCRSNTAVATCRLVRNVAPKSIFEALIKAEHLSDKPVAILGHSWGGQIVDALESSAAPIVARVNLEGQTSRLSEGRNHLFVATSGFGRRHKLASKPVAENIQFGDFAQGTAYKLLRTRGTHGTIIRDERVNRSVLEWLARAFGKPLGKDANPRFRSRAALAIALGAFLMGLMFLCPSSLSFRAPPLSVPPRAVLASLIALALGGAAGRWLASWLPSWSLMFKRLSNERLMLPVYVATAGVFALIVWMVTTRPHLTRTTTRGIVLGVVVGVVGALLLYVTLGWYVDRYLFVQIIPLARLPRLLVFVACAAPLVVVVHAIAPVPTQPWARLAAIGLLWTLLVWGWAWAQRGGVRKEAWELLPLVLVAESYALVLDRRTGLGAAGATIVALVLGWFWTVAYPVLG